MANCYCHQNTHWPGAYTYWNNIRVPVTAINPPGAATDPTRNSTNGLLEFSASATNVVAITVQLPAAWKEGSTISPHVHWRKKTAGAGNVLWRFSYEVVNQGALFTDSLTSRDATYTENDDGSALRCLLTHFHDVEMTGFRIGAQMIATISRIGGDAADTYAGVAQLLAYDIAYLQDQPGSASEYIK